MNVPFRIALSYLKGRRTNKLLSGITIISIVGIMVGVMTLTVVLSVMDGFERDLKNKVLGVNSHLIVQDRFGSELTDYETIIDTVTAHKEIIAAAPFIMGEGLILNQGRVFSVVIRGIDEDQEKKVTRYNEILKSGTESLGNNTIAIGIELARMLNVDIGDTVRLMSPSGKVTPIGMLPKIRDFKIARIFESNMYEYDTSLVYLSIPDAQKFLSRVGVSGVGVKVKDISRASIVASQVEKMFSPDLNLMTKDWFRMNKNLYSAMELEKKTMFIILTLIIIVAAFNIISILITMVKEKTKEIGVMKSLGFASRDVYKVFLYYGLISGGTGVVLGELLGLIICLVIKWSHINVLPADVYYSTELKVHMSVLNFAITGVLAFVITYGASVLPAWQAAKMDAVDAIKYE